MKKAEPLILTSFFFGIIMIAFHIVGYDIVFILSTIILALIYFYLGIAIFNNIRFRRIFKKESYKNLNLPLIINAILVGLALSITLVGILFKYQMWANPNFIITMGLVGLIIISIISLLVYKGDFRKYLKKIFLRTILIGAIGILMLSVETKTILDWRYPNNPEYVKALLESQKDPSNEDLWEKVQEERMKMQENE